MSSRTTLALLAAAGVLALVPVVYSRFLALEQQNLRAELASAKAEWTDLRSTQLGLDRDIEWLRQIQADIKSNLQEEENQSQLLSQALAGIQAKLRGAEKLQDALEELRGEYEGLKDDIEQYIRQ